MPTTINIYLDYPDVVYFPGQTVTGRVELSNTSPKNCRGVKVKFKGYSKVHWTEHRKQGKQNVTKHYRSSEEYYNTKYYLWGSGSEVELPPGNHVYDFSYVLPPNLPSSFESSFGKVRHEIKASLDIPLAFNKECIKLISVSSICDLNHINGIDSPIQRTKTKHLFSLFGKSGPLSFVLNVEKTGFVSGENMLINAECTNMSSRTMNKTKAKITQKVICYARGKSKSTSRTVASVVHPPIPKGQSDIWSDEALKIPPLAPSELPGCQNIRIEYKFEFSMDPGSFAFDLETDFPITIGTIPLRSAHQYIRAPPGGVVHPASLPVAPTVATAPPRAAWVPPEPDSVPVDEKKTLYPEGQPGYPSTPEAPPGYPAAPGAPPGYPSAPGAPPGYPAAPGASSGYPSAPGAPPSYPTAPGAPPGYPSAPGAPPGYPPAPGEPPGYPLAPGAPPSYPGGASPSVPPLGFPGLVNYPDMPPPSYDECVFGPQRIEHDSDDENSGKTSGEFAPRYVTYGFK